MHSVTLASKTFHLNDQVLFASLTGDFNPIHMNPVAARRMQAGTVVVHGIHAVLWALDKLAELGILTEQISSLRVQFTNFIPVGAQLELRLLNWGWAISSCGARDRGPSHGYPGRLLWPPGNGARGGQ